VRHGTNWFMFRKDRLCFASVACLLWCAAAKLPAQSLPNQLMQSLEEMEAAGTRMAFDVVSVKSNTSNVPATSHRFRGVPATRSLRTVAPFPRQISR
jgi:hypothetical protein